MACETIRDGGLTFIVCGRTRPKLCRFCRKTATALCDWITDREKKKMCDTPICNDHGKLVAADKHLCLPHQKQYEDWKAAHPDKEVPTPPEQGKLAL